MAKNITVKELAAIVAEQEVKIGAIDAKLDKLIEMQLTQAEKPAKAAKKAAKAASKKGSTVNPEPLTKAVYKKEPAKSGKGFKCRVYTPDIPYPGLYKSFKNNGWSFIDGAWQHFYSEEHEEQAKTAVKCFRPATEAEKEAIKSMFNAKGDPKPGVMANKRKNTKKASKKVA